MYKMMINNRCIMTRLLFLNGQKTNFSNIVLLSSIISSLLAFSPTPVHTNNAVESNNKTAKVEERPPIKTFTISNGTNPYKHILSDLEAELASESYSRINSIIR